MSFTYDQYNRLTGASNGVAIAYDALGRTETYTSPGGTSFGTVMDDRADLVAIALSGTIVSRFVHGPRLNEPLVEYAGSGTSSRFAGRSIPRIDR